jgi:hypothetical protein
VGAASDDHNLFQFARPPSLGGDDEDDRRDG